jgi:tetratricopeptide (TPR) repeat protein
VVNSDADNITGQEGDELLGLLDGLPLALAQAAAYMSEKGASFSTYTRLYVEQWQVLMEPHNGKHMPLRSYANGSVATTWTISYTAVRASNEGAAKLLLLWAHLDNKSMWYGLLTAASRQSNVAANRMLAWLGEMARSEMEFVTAVGLLRNYSLIEETEDQMGYAMHPVVHQWALSMQDDDQRTTLSWLAMVLVGIAVPLNDEAKYWETQAQLFPHAERCKERIDAMQERLEEQGFKEDAENVATLMWGIHGLGILYAERGKPDEAEKMYLLALEGYTKVLGPKDMSTLNTLVNLGNLYKDQGRLDEGENTLMRALEGCENVLGLEHISTLRSYNNIGLIYKEQGKLNEAEKMYTKALEGYNKTLGGGHTYTLGTLGNLGSVYRDQGRLDEAEKMFMQVLEGSTDVSEQEGIAISLTAIDSMWGLAVLFDHQHRVEEARLWYTKALAGYQQIYGENHAHCHALRQNLAGLDLLRAESGAGVESGSAKPENSPLQTVADVHVHEEPMASKRRHKWKRLGFLKRGADRSK